MNQKKPEDQDVESWLLEMATYHVKESYYYTTHAVINKIHAFTNPQKKETQLKYWYKYNQSAEDHSRLARKFLGKIWRYRTYHKKPIKYEKQGDFGLPE